MLIKPKCLSTQCLLMQAKDPGTAEATNTYQLSTGEHNKLGENYCKIKEILHILAKKSQ